MASENNGVVRDQFARALVRRMTVEQKVGQCIVYGMAGTIVTNDIKEAITRYHCGGVRLSPFTRKFTYAHEASKPSGENGRKVLQKLTPPGIPPCLTPSQFASMTNELKSLALNRDPAIPLHMVIDQEGDTSKDYAFGGVAQFPSAMGLAASKNPQMAYDVARALGRQLKAAGLEMIHSPVVDINTNPLNPEIGHRSFGDDPELVTEYALATLKGFKEEGVVAAAKHFPGRGDSATDAHHACPTLDAGIDRLTDVELYPYRKLIEAGLDSIMIAHCLYPQLDPEHIATVSPRIVTGLLREEMGFEGIITTDSMTMGALVREYGLGEACARSLAAGVDIILMKAEDSRRADVFEAVLRWVEEGKIDESDLDSKVQRIISMKDAYGMFDHMGIVDAEKTEESLRDSFVVSTAKKAAQGAVIVVKDSLKALPIDTKKKTLLISQLNEPKSPNDIFDHPSLLGHLMEQAWPTLQTYETFFAHDDEVYNQVLDFVAQGAYEQIICTNFYDRAWAPIKYPKKLIELGYPVILVTNTPYCVKNAGGMIEDAPTIVLNMNLTPQGLKTTRDVLFGLTEAGGEWPLSNYVPESISAQMATSG